MFGLPPSLYLELCQRKLLSNHLISRLRFHYREVPGGRDRSEPPSRGEFIAAQSPDDARAAAGGAGRARGMRADRALSRGAR